MYFEHCVLFAFLRNVMLLHIFNMQSDTMHNGEINTSIKMPFQV